MDAEKLTGRLQAILRDRRVRGGVGRAGESGGEPGAPGRPDPSGAPDPQDAVDVTVAGRALRLERPPTPAEAFGAEERRGRAGRYLVVERSVDQGSWHGDRTAGEYETLLARHTGALAVVAPDLARVAAGPPGSWLFFDLETTGLSGGAGTCAFLVGCGWFDAGRFSTAQFFLDDYDQEEAALTAVAELARRFSAVVTYNGRAFDLPLIATRYQLNRVESPFEGLPHLDTLHPARRLWRRVPRGEAVAEQRRFARGPGAWPGWQPEESSCSLTALEGRVLGAGRIGDVPGMEIPGRYFDYLRSRDATPLAAVVEHNRLDLLSLAALTSIVFELADRGADAARDAHECLALGRLYERAGDAGRADGCYRRAAGLEDAAAPAEGRRDQATRAEALYRLAVRLRRRRQYAEAADAWRRILDLDLAPGTLLRDASEALAIHHEHRARDFEAALAFARRALDAGPEDDRTARQALNHRLSRLERRLGASLAWEDER